MPTSAVPKVIFVLMPAESVDHCIDPSRNLWVSDVTDAWLDREAARLGIEKPALIRQLVRQGSKCRTSTL